MYSIQSYVPIEWYMYGSRTLHRVHIVGIDICYDLIQPVNFLFMRCPLVGVPPNMYVHNTLTLLEREERYPHPHPKQCYRSNK